MPVITAQQAGDPNRTAFLDMIAWSEGTSCIPESDDGYRVLVGATPDKPQTFSSYATHPDILNSRFNSTAAGRYQLLYRYWLAYRQQLKLPDFSPLSQDRIALQQIREKGRAAVYRCRQFYEGRATELEYLGEPARQRLRAARQHDYCLADRLRQCERRFGIRGIQPRVRQRPACNRSSPPPAPRPFAAISTKVSIT
ncbi:hypothetical protein SD235_00060 [Burkholderia cepacia]|uniref:hypothetical protein n=1 Tax=Burkholderia cepacia TaxID=292 RepID=UPI003A4D9044